MAETPRRDKELAATLDRVSVSLGGFPVLLDLCLQVKRGETLLLTGPNGAGKTTLLRVLAGLIRINKGYGEVLGMKVPGSERGLRAQVGLVSHESFLYEDLTVRDNLRFQAKMLRLDNSRLEKSIKLFDLGSHLGDQVVSTLSAGQKKRVTLCGLVMKNPPIWLLDEPHASLDKSARVLLDELIREASRRGTAVIVASHEMLDSKLSSGMKHVLIVAGKAFDASTGVVQIVDQDETVVNGGQN